MTSTCLKIIALVIMTIDHIGAYFPDMPIWLRWIGRIAAPLFFFCSAQGIVHTRDKRRYLCRLWTASIIQTLLDSAFVPFANAVFGIKLGGVNNNIFLTIFLGTLISAILESSKNDSRKRTDMLFRFISYQVILYMLNAVIDSYGIFSSLREIPVLCNWKRIVFTALGSFQFMEYPLIVMLSIVLFYVCKGSKKKLSICYSVYCLIYFLLFVPELGVRAAQLVENSGMNTIASRLVLLPFNILGITTVGTPVRFKLSLLYGNYQWMMIFSLPFMLAYNGKRGKGLKGIFYIYYPVHIMLFMIIGNLGNC